MGKDSANTQYIAETSGTIISVSGTDEEGFAIIISGDSAESVKIAKGLCENLIGTLFQEFDDATGPEDIVIGNEEHISEDEISDSGEGTPALANAADMPTEVPHVDINGLDPTLNQQASTYEDRQARIRLADLLVNTAIANDKKTEDEAFAFLTERLAAAGSLEAMMLQVRYVPQMRALPPWGKKHLIDQAVTHRLTRKSDISWQHELQYVRQRNARSWAKAEKKREKLMWNTKARRDAVARNKTKDTRNQQQKGMQKAQKGMQKAQGPRPPKNAKQWNS